MILSDFDGGSRLFGTRIVDLDAFDENNVWLEARWANAWGRDVYARE